MRATLFFLLAGVAIGYSSQRLRHGDSVHVVVKAPATAPSPAPAAPPPVQVPAPSPSPRISAAGSPTPSSSIDSDIVRAMRGTKTFVIAEENGLISVILAPQLAGARAKLPKHACRIRLNPPRSALREDNHVFDRAAALALVETNVIARITKAVPAATWTDTTIGGKRVTVSFGASRAKPIATVIELAGTLVPKGWKLEEAVVDPAPAQRLRALRHDAALAPKVSSKQIADGKRFAAALAKVPSPGSFRTQAGLHQTKLDARKISRALQWLSSVLPQADAPMRAVLGRAAAEAQLGVYINAHPRLRAFFFELGDGEDVVGLPLPMDEALARWLDVDLDDARRICGPLWQREMFQIAKAPRITVDASS